MRRRAPNKRAEQNILLAGGSAQTQREIKRRLGERYQLEAEANGEAALQLARERKPDLVLVDITAPGQSGLSLSRALRVDPLTRETPIILLCERGDDAVTLDGLDAGADDYLVLPCAARELRARVKAHIRLVPEHRRATHALSARVRELNQSNAEIREGRRATLNVLEDVVEARDRAEQLYAELRDRERWLRGQGDALTAAVNGAPLVTSLGALVATAIEALGEQTRAAFYLADDLGTSLHHVVGMSADYAEAVDGFQIGPESLACGLAAYSGDPVLTSDVQSDPRWVPWRWLAKHYEYRGCWSFPVHLAAKKFGGTFAVYWPEPRSATARDLELVSLITHAASIIVSRQAEVDDRKQAQKALRESEERSRPA